jgi:hypothetical protein
MKTVDKVLGTVNGMLTIIGLVVMALVASVMQTM